MSFFWKALLGLLGPLAVIGAIYWYIEHSGEKKGAAKVTAKVEAQHAVNVKQAKVDTSTMQASSDAVGARIALGTGREVDEVAKTIKELHDAYNARDAALATASPAFDLTVVFDPINRRGDDARRAADLADAARRAGDPGAP